MNSLQLHAFFDSSKKGYTAAIYLRVETTTVTHCQLITGKSKVAPLKKTTIPRLELCGAVLAAKLLNVVKITYNERLKIDETWTDSTTVLTWIHSSTYQDRIHSYLSTKQIRWHFNPPSSPHFGGLWEAGVKLTKSLILRSIGKQRLTGEELTTLLTQIEATLNSRPLCPLNNDPTYLEAVMPSHFLTLEPSTSLPDPTLDTIPLSKLQRWRLVFDLHRHFWKRWKNEYLSSLQARSKWFGNCEQLHVGDLVFIKEATHSLHWRLGRIRTVHPGTDGYTRIAEVTTPVGSITRPAVKLYPIPTS